MNPTQKHFSLTGVSLTKGNTYHYLLSSVSDLDFRKRLILLFLGLVSLCPILSANAVNLLENPNAEIGDTRGWIDPDDAWSAAREVLPVEGEKFFWPARRDLVYTEMYQEVTVSGMAADIDLGRRYLHLSGWLANFDQFPHDQATLAIQARDQSGQQLGYWFRSHRNYTWARYSIDALIPAGTRTLRVILIAQRFVGADNDAYFDDLSLGIDDQAPLYKVTITPEGGKAQMPVDGTLQLVAATSGGQDTHYTWSSSFEAIATVDTNGLVTASKEGHFTVQAEGHTTHAVGFLEIIAYSPNSLVITEPHLGAEWLAGTTQSIAWELKGLEATLSISFRSGGADWIQIASGIDAAALQQDWQVPATQIPLNQCQFRISWDGDEAFSPIFSIKPMVVQPISLSLQMYAGLSISGPVGSKILVQYVNQLTPTNWQILDTLVLTNDPQLWFDLESPGFPARYYRAVTAP